MVSRQYLWLRLGFINLLSSNMAECDCPYSKCCSACSTCCFKRRPRCWSACCVVSFLLTIFFSLAVGLGLADEIFFLIIKKVQVLVTYSFAVPDHFLGWSAARLGHIEVKDVVMSYMLDVISWGLLIDIISNRCQNVGSSNQIALFQIDYVMAYG